MGKQVVHTYEDNKLYRFFFENGITRRIYFEHVVNVNKSFVHQYLGYKTILALCDPTHYVICVSYKYDNKYSDTQIGLTGKCCTDETIDMAMVREIYEETGLTVTNMTPCRYVTKGRKATNYHYIYHPSDFTGNTSTLSTTSDTKKDNYTKKVLATIVGPLEDMLNLVQYFTHTNEQHLKNDTIYGIDLIQCKNLISYCPDDPDLFITK